MDSDRSRGSCIARLRDGSGGSRSGGSGSVGRAWKRHVGVLDITHLRDECQVSVTEQLIPLLVKRGVGVVDSAVVAVAHPVDVGAVDLLGAL